MPPDPLIRLRAICLARPDTTERLSHGEPTFFVRTKVFAMHASAGNHHGSGRPAVWIKAMPLNQELVIRDDPTRYFKPPYVGPSGWIGVWLDKRPPWSVIEGLIDDGFRQAAPRQVLAAMDGAPVSRAPIR